MENIYSLKINYNDLMNAYVRSLKVRAKQSVPPVPPVSSGTGSTDDDDYVIDCNEWGSY